MIGSSPRVWGTQVSSYVDDFNARFIPTRVGNTSTPALPKLRNSVHPHACGEHLHLCGHHVLRSGSSPRVWGTLVLNENETQDYRFIPTRVGNTGYPRPAGRGWPVHPHACGEHFQGILLQSSSTGSSPRVWGTQSPSATQRRRTRFIPTRVGNTR